MTATLHPFWKEPLVWFSLAGALLFAFDHTASSSSDDLQRIHVSQALVDAMRLQESQRVGREVGEEAVRMLVMRYVDEELLARHGTKLGLAEGDAIIRRRIAQKLLLAAEADVAEPSDDQLDQHLQAHAERYRQEERWSVEQRCYGQDEAGRQAAERALREHRPNEGARPLPFGEKLGFRSALELRDLLGGEVVTRLQSDSCTEWCGPVTSRHGHLLLRVQGHRPAAVPKLAEVRSKLVQGWVSEARQTARAARLSDLRKQYKIKIDWPADFGTRVAVGSP